MEINQFYELIYFPRIYSNVKYNSKLLGHQISFYQNFLSTCDSCQICSMHNWIRCKQSLSKKNLPLHEIGSVQRQMLRSCLHLYQLLHFVIRRYVDTFIPEYLQIDNERFVDKFSRGSIVSQIQSINHVERVGISGDQMRS